jgi:molybdopterin adenylyltransferase
MTHPSPIHDRLKSTSFRIAVITLSDRASQGLYDDKSGALIQQRLSDFFAANGLQLQITYHLIADEPETLTDIIQNHIASGTHYIITTGSTGIGPRDIAPDTVKPLLDKEIPGIMEYIRIKYGATMPNALLSRSIAGIAKGTIIYTLPGSPKAVTEYLDEIFKTLLHCHLMATAVDAH